MGESDSWRSRHAQNCGAGLPQRPLTIVTKVVTQMIKSFAHKGLQRLFETGSTQGVQAKHAQKLLDILDLLDAAAEAQDLNFPGSGLHQLKGERKGYWSVKVSANWRVTFRFEGGDAYDVNYWDYH